MSSSPDDRPTRRVPMKWHRVYFLLAAFDLFTVCLSLFLSHELVDLHASTVQGGMVWVSRLAQIDVLAKQAGIVATAGSDALSSNDVEAALARISPAVTQFNDTLRVLQNEFRTHITGAEVEGLLHDCARADEEMGQLIETSDSIVTLARLGRLDAVHLVISQKSHEYDNLLGTLNQLRADLRARRQRYVDGQVTDATNLAKFEWVLGGLILLMVVGLTMYGMRLEEHVSASESQLREAERKYRRLVEQSTDGILAVDASGKILFANRTMCDMLGYSLEELLRLTVEETYLPEDRIRGTGRRQSLQVGKATRFERTVRRKDNTCFAAEISLHHVEDDLYQGVIRDVTERRRIEDVLLQLAAIVESSEDAIFGTDLRGSITTWNAGAERLFGYSAREATGRSVEMIIPPERARERREVLGMIAHAERISQFETVCLMKKGNHVDVSISVSPIKDASGQIVGASTIARDISERNRLQQQLQQAQKVEAIGRLAGGVAHDFNNILTTIIGYCDLLREELGVQDNARANVEEISAAAERAASLTRQLLAFSRKQTLQPKVLDLNAVIGNLDKMLRRLIGEDVDLITKLAPDLGRVKADPGQIEQVLMNLAVNARDAMPDGGKLLIETANATLDSETACLPQDVTSGDYVMIAVTDTGTGMTEEVKAHLFEPFFTTKPQGHGTGLGLSTCYGIVKQSGGHIHVYSEVGHGTTFKVCLPRISEGALMDTPGAPMVVHKDGSETILLVEDDLSVRGLSARLLRSKGYNVVEASNGQEALRVAQERNPGEISLLLTDVIMPEMGGRELADQFRATHPNTKILFCSGYTQEAIDRGGELEPGTAFLQKPFTPSALNQKIREVLDQ
ncbi:MAG TPA: PAS domain S-box protein [Verrucomicrobiae bacterium]|nr:PAS domain S-box protein [Verrucomicrobiae bacterium]